MPVLKELIDLAWPVAAVVIAVVIILSFRKPIANVLESLADWQRIKAGKNYFEIIRREVAGVKAEIIPQLPPGPSTEALKSRVDRIEAANNSIIALSATLGFSTSAPTLGTPELKQNHALSAPGFSTGAPTLGTPELKQNPPSADTP
jgi:hypothetical protein